MKGKEVFVESKKQYSILDRYDIDYEKIMRKSG